MARVAFFGQAKVMERVACLSQAGSGDWSLVTVRAMHAPRGNDGIRPSGCIFQRLFVVGPCGIGGSAHHTGVCGANGKNIGRAKPAKAQAAGALLAPFDCRVVLHFGRRGRVEHDERKPRRGLIPYPREAIAVDLTIRIHGDRGRIPFGMGPRDHVVSWRC